ncbi:MAG: TIGR03960 family B12-binding radical SAM protein [Deltaproteobacteria bacterium]|nr:TIGR03960 family B12-binding radical SAM protein [Deltaproteobacteria bacterium]
MTEKEADRPVTEAAWFSRIERPSRYIGQEINAVRKDPSGVEVSIALAFPDVYEVGMSHLGIKILYHLLNSREWIAAERVFCPWTDLEGELRSRGLPLATLETSRPLSEFDIVGFSLQHELTFTNVLTMLNLSGIPFLAEERDDSWPLIIAGGPACFNPEPVAPLFDAVVIGDGEETALALCESLRAAKGRGRVRKEDLLPRLTRIEGVYVPSLFRIHHDETGIIRRIEPLLAGYEGVRKALIPAIDRVPFPLRQVVPFTELVHDRLVIEISRGCTRGCRFCQAGMIYRPVRERDPDAVIRDAQKALSLTGFDDLSLLSLSSGDYSCIGALLQALMDRQARDRVAVSLPSLRVDSLDPLWFEQIKRVRKTGFTLAAEAGNERLRAIINKDLTDREILNMAEEVYGAGWNLIKLYFMVGLPGEEEGDIEDIIALSREVVRLAKGKGKRPKLHVSVATFVPKSHTPFMWVPQISLEESLRRIDRIHSALRHPQIRVKWNRAEMSWLEGVFSRGDRRLTPALVDAWRMGARFDAWGEHFRKEVWDEAFKGRGVAPGFYLCRSRSLKEVLPWDHIQSGVDRDYLEREWGRAGEGKKTPDCRNGCLECGVCDREGIHPLIVKSWSPKDPGQPSVPGPEGARTRKIRITFSKTGAARHLSHLELVRVFTRAFRRAALDPVFSGGYHPMPKVSFASALPVGTESLQECLDLHCYDTLPALAIGKRLAGHLPKGIDIRSVEDITQERGQRRIRESHYEVSVNGFTLEKGLLTSFLRSEVFPVGKWGKRGERIVNARELVVSMDLTQEGRVTLVLRHVPGPELKPADIVKAVFQIPEGDVPGMEVLKTKQIMF